VLATVDGSDNDGIGVEVVTENLARVGQLEDALTDLWDSAVNLIEEEKHCTVAGVSQPVRRAEASDLAISARQTNKVALGHLRRAALDDGQTHVCGNLIHKLRLANTVATAKHKGLADVEDVGGDGNESLEIDSHDNSIIGRGS
jgi:hypothetical protein